MMKIISKSGALFVVIALFLSVSTSTWAGSALSSAQVNTYKHAKATGKLVEKGDGYLSASSGTNHKLVSLMEKVNTLRKIKYSTIAKKNKVSLRAVEMSAGKKLTGR
jgi:uncharacterized protein YdbL (DUF1318 family)